MVHVVSLVFVYVHRICVAAWAGIVMMNLAVLILFCFSFDAPLVRHQVAYLGLFENIRVRRAGFAYRQEYKQALDRWDINGIYWYYCNSYLMFVCDPGTKCSARKCGQIGKADRRMESERYWRLVYMLQPFTDQSLDSYSILDQLHTIVLIGLWKSKDWLHMRSFQDFH